MRQLTIQSGDWLTMEGRAPAEDEDLLIQPAGPLLIAARPGWVVVTGWRDLPGEEAPRWTVAMVRHSAVVVDDA